MFDFNIIKNIKVPFEVIEDNAGGLYLFIFCEDGGTKAYSGFEYYKNSLQSFIIDLSKNKENEINLYDSGIENPEELYYQLLYPDNGDKAKIIIYNNGYYINRMGLSAKKEFDIQEE